MDYKTQSDKSISNLSGIILDELQTCIKNFLECSLPTIMKRNDNKYSKILFESYGKCDNVFNILVKSIENLFKLIHCINIMDNNYIQHIELVLLLNYIKRLIYEKVSNNKHIISIPLKLPNNLSSKYYSSIENYGSYFGIINLFEKMEWITMCNSESGMRFDISECNRYMIEPLKILLQKLGEVYNSISDTEHLVINLFNFNDKKLMDILKTDNNRSFILWKKYLGLDKSNNGKHKNMDVLKLNYSEFMSTYHVECNDDLSKLI